MKRWRLAFLLGASLTITRAALGCGGTDAAPIGPSDGAAGDSTTGEAGNDGSAGEGAASDGPSSGDAGDGGPPACAAPGQPSQAALCVSVSPETIAFLADPAYDGHGLLVVQVFSRAHPDDDAGDASLTPGVLLPAQPDGGTADGGFALLDLSQPLAPIRFDGLPATTVYARALFVDDPATIASGKIQAGWWIGGFDLSKGLEQLPLSPVTLSAGQGTSVTLDLVALRKLTVTVSRAAGVTPAGNGQGPVQTVVVNTDTPSDSGTYLFGAGSLPCGKVDGTNQAVVPGFVLGKGPYWMVASLDDYGVGTSLPRGGMFSLEIDAGALVVPSGDMLTYPANAYQVTGAAALTLVSPWDGGADPVACP